MNHEAVEKYLKRLFDPKMLRAIRVTGFNMSISSRERLEPMVGRFGPEIKVDYQAILFDGTIVEGTIKTRSHTLGTTITATNTVEKMKKIREVKAKKEAERVDFGKELKDL